LEAERQAQDNVRAFFHKVQNALRFEVLRQVNRCQRGGAVISTGYIVSYFRQVLLDDTVGDPYLALRLPGSLEDTYKVLIAEHERLLEATRQVCKLHDSEYKYTEPVVTEVLMSILNIKH